MNLTIITKIFLVIIGLWIMSCGKDDIIGCWVGKDWVEVGGRSGWWEGIDECGSEVDDTDGCGWGLTKMEVEKEKVSL